MSHYLSPSRVRQDTYESKALWHIYGIGNNCVAPSLRAPGRWQTREASTVRMVSELVTTGGPTGTREGHGAAAIDGVLYVAGGTTNWLAGGELDDVWALDLSTRAWRKLGTMAAKRLRPAVRVNGAELWVVGGARVQGSSSVGEPTIVAFDRQSGAQRTVAVSGAWPPHGGFFWSSAPLGEGIVAIDSGDTVDNSTNQLWTLDVVGAEVKWINTDPAASDYAFYSQVGASADRRTAYFLGDDVWELKR